MGLHRTSIGTRTHLASYHYSRGKYPTENQYGYDKNRKVPYYVGVKEAYKRRTEEWRGQWKWSRWRKLKLSRLMPLGSEEKCNRYCHQWWDMQTDFGTRRNLVCWGCKGWSEGRGGLEWRERRVVGKERRVGVKGKEGWSEENFWGEEGKNKGKGGGEERTGFGGVIPGTHSSRQLQRSRLDKL